MPTGRGCWPRHIGSRVPCCRALWHPCRSALQLGVTRCSEEHVLDGAREPPGDRSPCEQRLYSEFAGILQVETRQRMSSVRIFLTIFCVGSMLYVLSRDTYQNRHRKKYRMLSPRYKHSPQLLGSLLAISVVGGRQRKHKGHVWLSRMQKAAEHFR
jgi:hypothetical protein